VKRSEQRGTNASQAWQSDGRAAECIRLQQHGASCLGWLAENLVRFSPWRDGRLAHGGVKAFAELAILYGYLEQWKDHPLAKKFALRENLVPLRAFILEHSEHPAYGEMTRKRPPQAFYLLLPYLILRATGYRASYHEDTLKRLRRCGYPRAMEMEMVPYRLLDQQYFLWKSGYSTREPNWYRLYRDTILGRRCSAVYIDHGAAYSITHTLFYLTDFGNHPLPLTVTDIEHATNVVECLLVHYWRLAHWDLVGELLSNLHCLGKRNSPFYSGAAMAFQRARRSDGAIPADQACEKELLSAQSPERGDLMFRACYHTTLVGVIYCFTGVKAFWQ